MTPREGSPRLLRVSCAQLDGRNGSPEERLRQADEAIRRGAVAARTDGVTDTLVILPELWPVGFFHFNEYAAAAQTIEGDLVTAVRHAARDAGVWVLGGSFIERGPEGLHNTTFLVEPDGGLSLTYRKIHLFGHESAEAELLVPGDEPRCVDTSWGRVGVMTCYDLRFPELARDLMNRGAEMIMVVSAWPAARIEQWRILLRARAVENQAWVFAANGAGDDAGVQLGGHSAIVAPDGTVVAEGGTEGQEVTAVIDAAESARVRRDLPFLPDRRYTVELMPDS